MTGMDTDAFEEAGGGGMETEEGMELAPVGAPVQSRRWMASIKERMRRANNYAVPNASATEEDLDAIIEGEDPYCWLCECTSTEKASTHVRNLRAFVQQMTGKIAPRVIWKALAMYHARQVEPYDNMPQDATIFALHFEEHETNATVDCDVMYRAARDVLNAVTNTIQEAPAGTVTLDAMRAYVLAAKAQRDAAAAMSKHK
jgi:hypothetical protein